ncbi:MAG TPA: hypothetical protein VHW96_06570 [Solirubrobacteraceae bacterium]|nr:hypothetical protein [Solirubrobacteraceae bacterium]
MKRIGLVGFAIASLLIIGVATALAATPHASKQKSKPSTVTVKTSCKSSLALQVPSGATAVSQGSTDGAEWGTSKCASLGSGPQWMSFTTDDSGDQSGKFQQWFSDGTVFGTFTLVPNDQGPPTTTSFTASSWTGKIVVAGGNGAEKKITGAGTLACATADAVHFTCTEKLKLIEPAPATGASKS